MQLLLYACMSVVFIDAIYILILKFALFLKYFYEL